MQETKLKLLERIVDRRQDSLYRFAYFRTGSQADAEDIVQDVLLRLFHSDCNLDRIDDVERYLWRAIANRCCDYHRHRRNATLPTERAAALADDSGDQELREEYERIAGLLATLPEEQAEVIRLKTSDSLTFARIAEITVAFFLQNRPVYFSGRHVGIFIQALVDETLVVAEIEVCLCAVIGNENLAVLIRAHGSGIDIQIRVKLAQTDFETA